VKFLLATTDPQKVPVTVLSRCLQLNLKRLLPEQIGEQLSHILQAEGIELEPQALALLARAADGSMRDGLSLLDQSIAFGGGRVTTDEVRTMLGTISRDLCLNLLQALARLDGPGLLDEVARIAELTPDFAGVLQELIGLLHRIALYQEVPATLGEEDPDGGRITELAAQIAPEDVQLFYQIALQGQQDLALAPDPRAGIEMVLLRMLAFRPDTGSETRASLATQGPQSSAAVTKPKREMPGVQVQKPAPGGRPDLTRPEDWHHLVADLALGGVASQLARNCELAEWDGRRLSLTLEPECRNLRVPFAEERLKGALAGVLGDALELEIHIATPRSETPARRQARHQDESRIRAETLMNGDPVVRSLQDEFDAHWVPGSIEATSQELSPATSPSQNRSKR